MPHSVLVQAYQRLSVQDPSWKIKAWLRIICAACAIASLVMFKSRIPDYYEIHPTSSINKACIISKNGYQGWAEGIGYTPVILSLLFNPLVHTFILTYCQRPGNIHPRWYAGADIIIVHLCVQAVDRVVKNGRFWYSRSTEILEMMSRIWGPQDPRVVTCEGVMYALFDKAVTTYGSLFLILVIHFVLFMMALRDLGKWRAEDARAEDEMFWPELKDL